MPEQPRTTWIARAVVPMAWFLFGVALVVAAANIPARPTAETITITIDLQLQQTGIVVFLVRFRRYANANPHFQWREALARTGRDFAVPALSVVGFFVVLGLTGESSGLIESYAQLLPCAIYCAMPTRIRYVFENFPGTLATVFFAPPALLLSGALIFFGSQDPVQRRGCRSNRFVRNRGIDGRSEVALSNGVA
jgi:hypothetical protein